MPRQPRIEVHDFWPRVLLSPVLGVGIASAVGLIDHRSQPALRLLGSALYFSALAFVIWEGNRRLYFRFRAPVRGSRTPAAHLRRSRRSSLRRADDGPCRDVGH